MCTCMHGVDGHVHMTDDEDQNFGMLLRNVRQFCSVVVDGVAARVSKVCPRLGDVYIVAVANPMVARII